MKLRDHRAMLLRIVITIIAATVIAYKLPSLVHEMAALLTPGITDLTFPFLDQLTCTISERNIETTGLLQLDMTLFNGDPLPAAPVTLNWNGVEIMNMFVIALAVWSAPHVTVKKRLLALPFTLIGISFAAAVFLSAEAQSTTLSYIGDTWLPTLQLEPTESNITYFKRIESRHVATQWFLSFLNGGGLLFMGVLSGLVGYRFVDRRI